MLIKKLVKEKKDLKWEVKSLKSQMEDMRFGSLIKKLLSKDKGDDNV